MLLRAGILRARRKMSAIAVANGVGVGTGTWYAWAQSVAMRECLYLTTYTRISLTFVQHVHCMTMWLCTDGTCIDGCSHFFRRTVFVLVYLSCTYISFTYIYMRVCCVGATCVPQPRRNYPSSQLLRGGTNICIDAVTCSWSGAVSQPRSLTYYLDIFAPAAHHIHTYIQQNCNSTQCTFVGL